MPRLPDFLVIGAMKSATTTLHEQLARQPGLFMSKTKEPNFFSDDAIYERGLDWYRGLFRDARPDVLCGESSTHYTKLPTYPQTVDRIAATLPNVRLIYVVRHPIERLASHFVHERTVGTVPDDLREALRSFPALVDYGRYAMQLEPFAQVFGLRRVLPVFMDRLTRHPQAELERIGTFLGVPGPVRWDQTLRPQNVGKERLRPSRVRQALVQSPWITPVRRRVVPRAVTERLKAYWRVGWEHPEIPPEIRTELAATFDEDLARLGEWLGISLCCANFHEVTADRPLDWVDSR